MTPESVNRGSRSPDSQSVTTDMDDPDPDPRRRPWPSSPLDNDDLLSEILFRLPPRPSSLPHASLVCKRWRRLATSPQFLRGFRSFHRAAPPLIGVFHNFDLGGPHRRFVSAVDPPDRVPAALFRLPCGSGHQSWTFLDCRHGRALLLGPPPREALVWDPMTGARHRAPLPPDAGDVRHGAVLCACGRAGDDCRSSPFDVVLVWWKQEAQCSRAVAAVYSSEHREWSEIVSPPFPSTTTLPTGDERKRKPGTHAGDAIYWLLSGSSILEFDPIRRSLALIMLPVGFAESRYQQCQLVLIEDRDLGLAVATEMDIMVWKRDSSTNSSTSSAGWFLHRSVELDRCLPLETGTPRIQPSLLGFHEESNMIFVWINAGVFMLQLKSMESRMVCQGHGDFVIYPFSGFYTAGGAGEQAIDAPGPAADSASEGFLWLLFTAMWHYTDPQGCVQGPFALERLLVWKQDGFFDEGFRVWRTDQTKEHSVLLSELAQHDSMPAPLLAG